MIVAYTLLGPCAPAPSSWRLPDSSRLAGRRGFSSLVDFGCQVVPERGRKTMELGDRFWSKVDRSGGSDACWEWRAYKNSDGYGCFRLGSKTDGTARDAKAHRIAYELLVGRIPAGLVIDHLCRNRSCVNPAHMEPVTARENILRGEGVCANYARQTHCVRGHELNDENTYPAARGRKRSCRLCRKEQG